MKKKAKHFYHEPQIGKQGNADCAVKEYDKPMPVYPKALRFCITDYEMAFQYLQGASDFVRSTKIPESCDSCPLEECHYLRGWSDCHELWRKIWEYVK